MGLKVDMDARGIRYEAARGQGLPMHEHPNYAMTHDVTCVEGEIMLFFDNGAITLKAGESVKPIEVHVRHGIAVLSDRAVWFNAYAEGEPPAYAAMPEDQRHTVLDSPCDAPRRFLNKAGD